MAPFLAKIRDEIQRALEDEDGGGRGRVRAFRVDGCNRWTGWGENGFRVHALDSLEGFGGDVFVEVGRVTEWLENWFFGQEQRK